MKEIIDLIDEFIYDLENSPLYDRIKDENFQKERLNLIDFLEIYKNNLED